MLYLRPGMACAELAFPLHTLQQGTQWPALPPELRSSSSEAVVTTSITES